jgi:hypothetical protein
MFRKSILLFSSLSLVALIAWGITLIGATPASASAALPEPAMNADCRLKITTNAPTLVGPLYHPESVNVSWTVDNVPPCYRISSIQVTFNIVQRDGDNKQKIVNVPGNATSASAQLLLNVPEAARLFKKDRPTPVTATVVATAVPVDSQIRTSDVETSEVTPR